VLDQGAHNAAAPHKGGDCSDAAVGGGARAGTGPGSVVHVYLHSTTNYCNDEVTEGSRTLSKEGEAPAKARVGCTGAAVPNA
jgi:hypothetical protein